VIFLLKGQFFFLCESDFFLVTWLLNAGRTWLLFGEDYPKASWFKYLSQKIFTNGGSG